MTVVGISWMKVGPDGKGLVENAKMSAETVKDKVMGR